MKSGVAIWQYITCRLLQSFLSVCLFCHIYKSLLIYHDLYVDAICKMGTDSISMNKTSVVIFQMAYFCFYEFLTAINEKVDRMV